MPPATLTARDVPPGLAAGIAGRGNGMPAPVTGAFATFMTLGDGADFAAGTGDAQHLVDRCDADDCLAARMAPDGAWVYSRKSGTPL